MLCTRDGKLGKCREAAISEYDFSSPKMRYNLGTSTKRPFVRNNPGRATCCIRETVINNDSRRIRPSAYHSSAFIKSSSHLCPFLPICAHILHKYECARDRFPIMHREADFVYCTFAHTDHRTGSQVAPRRVPPLHFYDYAGQQNTSDPSLH